MPRTVPAKPSAKKTPAKPRKGATKRGSTGRRRPKQERSRALVDAILTATAQLLRNEGSSATTTNKIAARAGVSVGSLYQYFPNKTALYTALAERHIAETDAKVVPLLEQFRDKPDVDIVRLIVESLALVQSVDAPLHAELQRLSLWGHTSDVMTDAMLRSEAQVAEILRQHADVLPRRLDNPEISARLLVRAVGGVFDTSLFHRPSDVADPAFIAALTELVAAYLGFELDG